jgi:hypothetical protein
MVSQPEVVADVIQTAAAAARRSGKLETAAVR